MRRIHRKYSLPVASLAFLGAIWWAHGSNPDVTFPFSASPSNRAQESTPAIHTKIAEGSLASGQGHDPERLVVAAHKPDRVYLGTARPGWAKDYPRGLGSAVLEARDRHDGGNALQLAESLSQCVYVDANLASEQQIVLSARNDAERASAARSMAFYEAVKTQCQTLQGDPKQLATEMLKLATDAGVVGAAAKYFLALGAAQTPDKPPTSLFQQIASDAAKGDAWSMSLAAYEHGKDWGLPDRDRVVYLNALARLATDSEHYNAAANAFSLALSAAKQRNSLPPGVTADKYFLTADEMKTVLVGKWAVTDDEGRNRVDALVKAAKELSRRS